MNDYFLSMKPHENKIKLMKASIDHIVNFEFFQLLYFNIALIYLKTFFKNFSGPDAPNTNAITLFVSSNKDLSVFEIIKAFSSFGHSEVSLNSKKTAIVTIESHPK